MCDCEKYSDLKIDHDELTRREKEFKKISSQLDKVVDGERGTTLYKCSTCGQHWQSTWITYNRTLIFKVPTISAEEWKKECFVTPTFLSLFLHYAGMYLKQLPLLKFKNEKCKHENCNNKCIANSVFCLRHHMTDQKIKVVAQIPSNVRWFPPYKYEDFEITDERIETFFKENKSVNSTLPKMGGSWLQNIFAKN